MTKFGARRVFGLPLRAADAVILGGFSLFLSLAIVFNGRLERPAAIISRLIIFGILYAGTVIWLKHLKRKGLRFLLRTASVQFMYLQTYLAGRDLQLLFSNWHDDAVLKWEGMLFGGQPLVWIQNFYSPLLAEWMFFVYVVYIIIYPLLGAVIFFKRDEDAHEDYLYQLGLINLVCGLGFVLYPVAGPLRWEKARILLSEPLPLRFFGQLAEYIRSNVHAPGGTIPSPHCAVATVMWFMSLKYTKWGFYILTPVILSLYVSTVYGRFHYISDMIIGILVAIPILLFAPALAQVWNKRAEHLAGGYA